MKRFPRGKSKGRPGSHDMYLTTGIHGGNPSGVLWAWARVLDPASEPVKVVVEGGPVGGGGEDGVVAAGMVGSGPDP